MKHKIKTFIAVLCMKKKNKEQSTLKTAPFTLTTLSLSSLFCIYLCWNELIDTFIYTFVGTLKLNLLRFFSLHFVVWAANKINAHWQHINNRLLAHHYFVFYIDFMNAINIISQLEIEIIQRFFFLACSLRC